MVPAYHGALRAVAGAVPEQAPEDLPAFNWSACALVVPLSSLRRAPRAQTLT